jgi:hypothetical protein
MNVRAKFWCKEKHQRSYTSAIEYNFDAVCADDVPENQRYHKYTPQGNMSITVDNPTVEFELGKYYYLDFTPAD